MSVTINMGLLNIVLLAALCAAAAATVIETIKCSESSDDICKVTEVRISPCKTPKTCVLKKGKNVTMSFDFIPNFSSSQLTTSVFWVHDDDFLKFDDFGSDDACAYTQCPTKVGKDQTLEYQLYVGKKLPTGIYPIKWQLWNTEKGNEMCCFRTTIRLSR